jgi:hypothetical protein
MSGQQKKQVNKKTEQMPSIDEIRKLTETNKTTYEDKLRKAMQMAYDKIIDGATEKILLSAKKGLSEATLYEWEYQEIPDDKYKFNDFTIAKLTRCELDGKSLKIMLEDYFNKDNKGDRYYIYISKNKKIPTKYSLGISWRVPKNTDNTD